MIGAGISGLSLAYFLQNKGKLLLIEQNDHPGGWLHTKKENGFLFEMGPRAFKASKSNTLLSLIDLLGLKDDLIYSSKKATKRFLCYNNQMHPIPTSLKEIVRSPLAKGLIGSVVKGLFHKKADREENIAQFVERRCPHPVIKALFDAFSTAIHAAHPEELSLSMTFPSVNRLEKHWMKNLFHLFFAGGLGNTLTYTDLCSLKSGNDAIVRKITSNLGKDLVLGCKAQKIENKEKRWHVETTLGKVVADHLFLSVPKEAAFSLLSDIARPIPQFSSTTIAAVHLGYKQNLLTEPNFGYLFPSTEGELSTGITCESAIFPQKNSHEKETRFCVKFGSTKEQSIDHLNDDKLKQMAKDLLHRRLNITRSPDAELITYAKNAIPKFEVGYQKKISTFVDKLKTYYPNLHLLGNYLHGAFVDHCIEKAYQLSKQY